MKNPDWDGFVAAIVANPEDDALRLVAADFLEEHGEAQRAAFIRVQVQLARLEASEQGKSLEADELRKKERAILGPLSEAPRLWAAEECPELVHGVFTRLGTGTWIAEGLLALPVPPMVLMAVLMGVIFLLGWPLEWPAIVLIFLPIFLPVVTALKFDLVWFGTLVAVNLQTAFLSPPVAMAAYYLKAVAPTWELKDIYRGMFDFMLLQVIGLAAVFFFPQVALWLPTVLFR